MYQNLSNLISVLPSILKDPINYITSYTTGSFLHEIHINTFFSFISCMWNKVVKLKIKRHKPLVRLSWRCNIFSLKLESSPWKPLVWDKIALVVFMFVFSHHLTLFFPFLSCQYGCEAHKITFILRDGHFNFLRNFYKNLGLNLILIVQRTIRCDNNKLQISEKSWTIFFSIKTFNKATYKAFFV